MGRLIYITAFVGLLWWIPWVGQAQNRPGPTQSGDTLSVYFDFGKHKLEPDQFETLNRIPELYSMEALYGVRFIGMADSVGSIEDNIKLSERRARAVAKYCRNIIPRKVPVRMAALGERARKDPAYSRRVDVVFFLRETEAEPLVADSTLPDTSDNSQPCFVIDNKLIHRSHIRTVLNKEREYTFIEIDPAARKKGRKLFWAEDNAEGEFVTHKVKWRNAYTGKRWWAKRRMVTSIPKTSFDQYRIFYLDPPPCDSCAEDLAANRAIVGADTCIQVDRFLMANIQYKPFPFRRRKKARIRAPREYVDLNSRYFIGCGQQEELVWTTKRGYFRKQYYFARLPWYDDYSLWNITRMMSCCRARHEPSDCDLRTCEPVPCVSVGEDAFLNLEIGNNLYVDQARPYAMVGVVKEFSGHRFTLMGGTDTDWGFYGSGRYQFHFASFPFFKVLPFSQWHTPDPRSGIEVYPRLYAGTELRTHQGRNAPNYLEQNIHLGIAITNAARGAFISRVFIQQGAAIDYLRNNSMDPYFPFQVGINMNLVRVDWW